MSPTLRPQSYLTIYREKYPKIWDMVATMRGGQGTLWDEWPKWCFVPLRFVMNAPLWAEHEKVTEERISDAYNIAALAAWRMTKGVYRFDETTFDAIWNTPLEGDLPIHILKQLPEWCLYIEVGRDLPTTIGIPMRLHGFFVRLDPGHNGKPDTIEFLLDYTQGERDGLSPVPVLLKDGSLVQTVTQHWEEVVKRAPQVANDSKLTREEVQRGVRETGAPLMSLVIYLCSAQIDIRDKQRTERLPKNPAINKKKRREIPPEGATIWEVGYRMGAAIRGALAEETRENAFAERESGVRKPTRPHIRRAHWHTFLAGPRSEEREKRVKWVPPIPVKLSDVELDSMPSIVHQVK